MARNVIFRDELYINTIGPMANELLNALQAGQEVQVDLSGVTGMDCAALQVLVAATKEAEASGVTIAFTIPGELRSYATTLGISL